MSVQSSSPRAFQAAVLVLLVVGIGLLVLQQQRIGELEARIGTAAPSGTSLPRLEAGRAEPPRQFVAAPSAAPGTVVQSGLTLAEALKVAEDIQRMPPPPPAASVTVPEFLAQQRISPELWKKVQAVNQKSAADLHELARTFPSGTVPESEVRLAKLEAERKSKVRKLLTPEQMSAYEAMRTTGAVEGVIMLADGAIKRWVYLY